MKKDTEAPTEMFICEISHLILHPDQTYIFRVHSDCKKCKAYFVGPPREIAFGGTR